MSNINELRAELSRLERINQELNAELWEIQNGVDNATQSLVNFRNYMTATMDEGKRAIDNAHAKILDAYEVQGQIDQLYVRFKQMELANKKIRECNNKKYYEFGNYRTVRKIVQGIMDNLNVQMVSDEVIYKSVEKQHLKTPDYWLTCVLLSIMAWKNDDRELADRAMDRAIRLDKKNSSIFYMLFNIRMRRENAALKWFSVYQECDLKGSDEETFLMLFSLLSKTIDEQVDDHTKYEIYSFINKVIAVSAQAEGFSEADIIDLIERNLLALSPGYTLQLNLLQKCCDDFQKISDMVMMAQNNIQILQFILDVSNVSEIEKNEYLSKFIDKEIERPNDQESAVYDEIERNEIIIRCEGDVERADAIFQQEKERREKALDLIREMIGWVYGRTSEDVNVQARKNMFMLTGALQKKGVKKYADDYRSMDTSLHPITLGEYRTTADFQDQTGEEGKIASFYEAQKHEKISQIKYTGAFVGIGIVIAAVIAAVALNPLFAAGAALGALYSLYVFVSNERKKKQIARDCELSISGKTELLRKLFGEYAQMKQIYYEFDAYQEQIEEALQSL